MENFPQEQRKQRLIQSKPSEKGEIITYLSRMGDVLERVPYGDAVINAVDRVHAVVDGDIANMVLGKGFFQQDAYHQPIPAQAGVVFDDNGRHPSRLYLCHHLQIGRTVEGDTGVSIIHKGPEILKAVPFYVLF